MLLTFGSIKRKTKTFYNAIGEEVKSPMTAVCGEAMWILHLQRSLAVVQSVLPRVYDRALLCWRRIVCSFCSMIWMVSIKTRVALWDQDGKAYFRHLSFAFRYRCALSAIETLFASGVASGYAGYGGAVHIFAFGPGADMLRHCSLHYVYVLDEKC